MNRKEKQIQNNIKNLNLFLPDSVLEAPELLQDTLALIQRLQDDRANFGGPKMPVQLVGLGTEVGRDKPGMAIASQHSGEFQFCGLDPGPDARG